MLTGAVVRGAFTRISSLATTGARSLVRQAPRLKMDISSISLGRILQNAKKGITTAGWSGPGLSAIRHMQNVGAFGSNPTSSMKYLVGSTFVSFAKRTGLQSNHNSTDGLSFALHKGRHTNLI